MAGFGDKPFGLRDLKITNLAGSTQVDLPSAMTLGFKERITSGELRGDDSVQALVSITDAVELALEAGGLSLEAYAILTGRAVVAAGTTPNRTVTLSGNPGDNWPYVKIYGKSVGDVGTDDIHAKFNKAKVTGPIEGEWKDAEFFITKCDLVALKPTTGNMFDIVQNETAANLPTS